MRKIIKKFKEQKVRNILFVLTMAFIMAHLVYIVIQLNKIIAIIHK